MTSTPTFPPNKTAAQRFSRSRSSPTRGARSPAVLDDHGAPTFLVELVGIAPTCASSSPAPARRRSPARSPRRRCGATCDRRVEAIATTDIVANPRDCLARGPRPCWCRSPGPATARRASRPPQLADDLVDEVRHLVLTCDPRRRAGPRARGSRATRCVVLHAGAHQRPGLRDDVELHLDDAGLLCCCCGPATARRTRRAAGRAAEQVLGQQPDIRRAGADQSSASSTSAAGRWRGWHASPP